MRRIELLLPLKVHGLALIVQNEIQKLSNPKVELNNDNYIYLVLQVSSFAEQSMKLIRNMIIGYSTSSQSIQHYFRMKNNRQPLYASPKDFSKMVKDFGIDIEDYKWNTTSKISGQLVFENRVECSSFIEKITKLRNAAAHEVVPNMQLNIDDLMKMFDFVALFIS